MSATASHVLPLARSEAAGLGRAAMTTQRDWSTLRLDPECRLIAAV